MRRQRTGRQQARRAKEGKGGPPTPVGNGENGCGTGCENGGGRNGGNGGGDGGTGRAPGLTG